MCQHIFYFFEKSFSASVPARSDWLQNDLIRLVLARTGIYIDIWQNIKAVIKKDLIGCICKYGAKIKTADYLPA